MIRGYVFIILFITCFHNIVHAQNISQKDKDSLIHNITPIYTLKLYDFHPDKGSYSYYKIYETYLKDLIISHDSNRKEVTIKDVKSTITLNNAYWILKENFMLYTTNKDYKTQLVSNNVQSIYKINDYFIAVFYNDRSMKIFNNDKIIIFECEMPIVYWPNGNHSSIGIYDMKKQVFDIIDFELNTMDSKKYQVEIPDIYISKSKAEKLLIYFKDEFTLEYIDINNINKKVKVNSLLRFNIKNKKLYEWNEDNHLVIPVTQISKNQEVNNEVKISYTYSDNKKNVLQNSFSIWDIKKEKFIRLPYELGFTERIIDSLNHILRLDLLENSGDTLYKPEQTIVLTYKNSREIKLKGFDLNDFAYFKNANKYVYFKCGEWYIYDLDLNKEYTIPSLVKGQFRDESLYGKLQDVPFHPPIQSTSGHLIVYDAYDIFFIDLIDLSTHRITNGRENNTTYRFADIHIQSPVSTNWQAYKKYILKDSDKWFIIGNNNLSFEKSLWTYQKNKQKMSLISKGMNTYQDILYKDNCLLYIKESFNLPPEIWSYNLNKEKKLFTSNTNRNDLKTKVLLLSDSTDINAKATLYFPKDYDSNNFYPMIVRVYEDKSKELHIFEIPNLFSATGFNKRNYILNDYFILEPNIEFNLENVGFDALKEIEKWVYIAIESASIDIENIGITGISFGGYQTNFIMGNSKLFKTGVSGVSISDFPSLYLSTSKQTNKPEFWRFERQQLRMKKSLFDSYDKYVKNSPIYYAKNFHNPILLWVGMKDTNLPSDQTLYMYNALKRNQKEAVLIEYLNEGHSLRDSKNQLDLSNKIMEWFNYHLKNGKRPDWF